MQKSKDLDPKREREDKEVARTGTGDQGEEEPLAVSGYQVAPSAGFYRALLQ
jgi:hypothetical protein